MFRKSSRIIFALLVLSLFGCAVVARRQLLDLYGPEKVQTREVVSLPPGAVDFWTKVKPVFDRRCAVCHSCYDAPCQFKIGSPEGIDRGASKEDIYDSERLFPMDPSRLFVDASSTREWRDRDFYPTLNERRQDAQTNLDASVLYRLLKLKNDNPFQSDEKILPDSMNLSLGRANTCPRLEEMDGYEAVHPKWGMPYGFPAISPSEFGTVKTWLEQGGIYTKRKELPESLQAEVKSWEDFLNGDSLKDQLSSRYLYEHLFLADIYFDDVSHNESFKLVRSKTAPGVPVEIIPTRRPYEDPGVKRAYYRFVLNKESVSAKTHMPYVMNREKRTRLQELFYSAEFPVTALPSYEAEVASNPFIAFSELPLTSRYKFMLDNAAYVISGFIKGPVCRGQTALNVIDDRFWVVFTNPDLDPTLQDPKFLADQATNLQLPAELGDTGRILTGWYKFYYAEQRFLEAKAEFLKNLPESVRHISYDTLWNGETVNQNAALTVFRHFDSATVVNGLVGDTPKTAWVIGYPLLERIHYLLVSGFDIFGNVGHQLLTRLYMDFLRVEGENNFLLFLPKEIREKEHAFWYRGLGDEGERYSFTGQGSEWIQPNINYKSLTPKGEFFDGIKKQFGNAINYSYDVPSSNPLKRLSFIKGKSASFMPEMSVIQLKNPSGGSEIYTLLVDRGHTNIAMIFSEASRMLPDEDALVIARGFIGVYPNMYFVVDSSRIQEFTKAVSDLESDGDYRKLVDMFGIRRTAPDFWKHSDFFQEQFEVMNFGRAGILDLNRYENR